MNSKKQELIKKIQGFLHQEISAEQLNSFAWDMIDFFSLSKNQNLSTRVEPEKEFWYAIWQIQHLAEESDGFLIKKEMQKALKYLTGEEELPTDARGERPL